MRMILLTLGLLWLTSQAAFGLPHPTGQDIVHEVKPGETLHTIARLYGLAPDQVMWANDMGFKHGARPGDKLKIPLRRIPPAAIDGGTSLVLNLPERMLYLYRGGAMVKFYGVAIGGDDYRTPTGTFSIMAKEKNPTWEPPKWLNKKPIGPGPDNPLGDRWMQITPNMVGIHGTNDPDSIGGVASLGCIRLYPEAIHDLYEQVSVGTRVKIIYEQVRLGAEPDGTLVWAFFPDPYHKWLMEAQAQDWLAQARHEGHEITLTDLEIQEAREQPLGLIRPVFGQPVELRMADQVSRTSAYLKPTGNWLDATVLEERGYKLSNDGKTKIVTITDPEGKKVVVVRPEKIPLNPLRVPRDQGEDPFKVDGFRWKGKTWVPFPLVLDYFDIPYEWNARTAVLELYGDGQKPLPR